MDEEEVTGNTNLHVAVVLTWTIGSKPVVSVISVVWYSVVGA